MKKRKNKKTGNNYKDIKHRSPLGEVWKNLRHNKGAIIGAIIILILTFFCLFADVLFDYETEIIKNHAKERLQHPNSEHWLGTDHLGRDVLKRLLYGAKYSLPIGLVACIAGMTIGVLIGAVSGYVGGVTDIIIQRIVDIFAAIPGFLLAMILVYALNAKGMGPLMVSMGVGSIWGFSRTARTAVMMNRNQEYVESALAIGESHLEIIYRHVLPNSISRLLVSVSLRMGSAIISASSLSYLGLGIQPPAPEWGAMLSEGRQFARDYSYLTIAPGLFIMITVIAFNLIGDGLRDAMDPKLKR